MTAEVFRASTHHDHDREAVVRQEYEMAKEHYRQVVLHGDPLNPDHARRFHGARFRLGEARERWLGVVCG